MAIKPILLSTEMVQAILEGRKSATRRAVKPQPKGNMYPMPMVEQWPNYYGCTGTDELFMPPYHPGDILWVRETWCENNNPQSENLGGYEYLASYDEAICQKLIRWHHSIYMPKKAARIFLRVKDVRAERLQDITELDAEKEGIRYSDDVCQDEDWSPTFYDPDSGGDPSLTKGLSVIWNSTLKKSDLPRYGWNANPWVWVIEFERCEGPEGWDP